MDIQRIRIMMATNIPNSKPIEFTGNMLYHPSYPEMKNIGTYPYITDTIDYSDMYIDDLTYPQIAAIFFDRVKFIRMVSKTIPVSDADKPATLERNVMTMLKLLLPTKFFAVNNHKQSIKLLDPEVDVVDSSSIFYNPLKTESSYIIINGKRYTITEVVWLNDILNHPTYRKLLEEVYILNRSLNTYKSTLTTKIDAYKDRLIGLMDEINKIIADAIQNTPSATGVATPVSTGYANEKTYSAIFTILRLKKLLLGEPIDIVTIYNELYETPNTAGKVIQSVPVSSVTSATNPFTKITKMSSGITLEDQLNSIATEPVTDLKSSPIQISRFEKVLALMSEYRTELIRTITMADNADKVALVTKTTELFNVTVLKEGSNLAAQVKATDSIVFSKQIYGSPDYIPVLSQFKTNTLYKYRRPNLTSENDKLQEYIDNDTNPALVTEWFKEFGAIYEKYILKSTASLNIKKDLLSLKVNNINMETTDRNQPTKDMFIRLTVIDGEVNNDNKTQIYCPLTSDKLGSELLTLIENTTDYADLLNEDVSLFAVKTLSASVGSDKGQSSLGEAQNVQDKYDPNKNVPNLNKNIPNPVGPSFAFTQNASTKFGPILIASANPDVLKDLIMSIRQNPAIKLDLDPESILRFISNTYTDSTGRSSSDNLPDLPRLINEWSQSNRRANKDVEEKVTIMNADLNGKQLIFENKMKDSKVVSNPAERSKVANQLAIIKFYKYIGELLLKNEQSKAVDKQVGGKKKKNKRHTTKLNAKVVNNTSKRRKH